MNTQIQCNLQICYLCIIANIVFVSSWLSFFNAFSLFSEIVWLHLTVTPSISMENKHKISASDALFDSTQTELSQNQTQRVAAVFLILFLLPAAVLPASKVIRSAKSFNESRFSPSTTLAKKLNETNFKPS